MGKKAFKMKLREMSSGDFPDLSLSKVVANYAHSLG